MSVCDVPVISSVCNVAGEAAATLVSAPFEWLAQAIGATASWLFESVWAVIDSTTRIDLTNSEYIAVYNIVFGLAVLLSLLFASFGLIGGMIRRDPRAITQAALGLAKSILGSFVALGLTATLLELTDQLTIGLVQATGSNMEELGARIGVLVAGLTAINITAPGVGAVITIAIGALAIGGALLVWVSLLVRKALVLISVALAPIALAGSSWHATRGWFGKWATFVIALAVSKPLIVLMLLVASAQVSAPIDADLADLADPVAGIVLLLLAGFAPYASYKLLSFTGIDQWHAASTEQEAKQALNRPIPTPDTTMAPATRVLTGQDRPDVTAPDAPSEGPSPTKPGEQSVVTEQADSIPDTHVDPPPDEPTSETTEDGPGPHNDRHDPSSTTHEGSLDTRDTGGDNGAAPGTGPDSTIGQTTAESASGGTATTGAKTAVNSGAKAGDVGTSHIDGANEQATGETATNSEPHKAPHSPAAAPSPPADTDTPDRSASSRGTTAVPPPASDATVVSPSPPLPSQDQPTQAIPPVVDAPEEPSDGRADPQDPLP